MCYVEKTTLVISTEAPVSSVEDRNRGEVEKSALLASWPDFSTSSVPSKIGPDYARNDILKFFSTKQYECEM